MKDCDNVSNPGRIYHNQSSDALVKFCDSWQPAPISQTQSASGGSGGTVEYQWQYKIEEGNWNDITINEGQDNDLNLGQSNVIQFFNNNGVQTDRTTTFRRGARRSDCNEHLYSNEVRYQVYPNVSDDVPAIQVGLFCNFPSNEHCISVGAGNTTDVYEFLWRFSYDNENWIHTSTELPADYCYPSGTTAYISTGSRLIGSPCDYIFKPSHEIITQRTPELSLAIEEVSCIGENDGEITISDESGNSPTLTDLYTYSIDNGQTWQSNPTFSSLGEGNYTIQVQTQHCSSYSISISLAASSSPALENVDVESESDCGENDGSISISLSGGSGQFEYRLSTTAWQNSPSFNNLSSGIYDLYARNQDGSCETYLNQANIEGPNSPSLSSIETTSPTNCGVDNGQINIQASGGQGPLEFSIDAGANWRTDPLFTSLAEGDYDAGVRNQDGTCALFSSVSLDAPTAPEIQNVSSENPSDCGSSNGQISIQADVSGGTIQYSINGGETWSTQNTYNGLPAGFYEIQVRKSDGTCLVSYSPIIELSAPSSPEASSIEVDQPSDCQVDDGEIRIFPNSSQWEYSVDGGNNWQSGSGVFSNLGPGTYEPFIRNADGTCTTAAGPSIELNYPNQASIVSIDYGNPTDWCITDGYLTIDATGGQGGLEYTRNGIVWQSSPNFTSGLGTATLLPGVRNADGSCEVFYPQSISIDYPDRPTIAQVIETADSGCGANDGSILIEVTDGIGAFEYSIDNGNSWQNSPLFEELSSSNYDIAVRNQNGSCNVTEDAYVSVLLKPRITDIGVETPSDCGLSDATISMIGDRGTGDYEFSIDAGQNWYSNSNFNDLAPGEYWLGIRNSNGFCEVFENTSVTIEEHPHKVITNVSVDQPSDCDSDDGEITLTAQGNGFSEYSIDGGSNWQSSRTFRELGPGNYQPAVRNTDGTCLKFYEETFTLNYPPRPIFEDVIATGTSDCGVEDGSIEVIAGEGIGSFLYSINDGNAWQNSATFTGLRATSYGKLAIRNSDGTCFEAYSGSIQVSQPPKPTFDDLEIDQPSDCDVDDGSILIVGDDGIGNYEYSFDGGSTWQQQDELNGLEPGSYLPGIRNSDGTCPIFKNNPTNLAYPPEPSIADVEVDQPSDCGNNDGSISIQAADGTGNFQYSINGGNSWKNNGNFNNLQPGEYEIAVRNSNGTCFIIDNQAIDLAYPPEPSIADIEVDQPSDCGNNDGSINILAANGTGNFQYSINGGSSWKNNGNFNNLQPGEYEIAVRNSNGTCFIIDNQAIDLAYPPEPSIADIDVDQPSDCGNNDGSISIQAANGTGNFQYSINGGNSWKNNGSFNNLQPGEYEIAVRNSNGTCFTIDNQAIDLAYPPEPSIADIDVDQPSDCGNNDGSISIQAAAGTGNFQYSINGGNSWKNNGNFNNLQPGEYEIALRNSNGTCFIIDNQAIDLAYPPEPSIADVEVDQPSDCGNNDGSINIQAVNGTGNFQYSINGGNSWKNNGNFNNLQPGEYEIAVRNSNGTCFTIDNQAIDLAYPPEPSIADIEVDQPSDCGNNDGSINILAANGTGNFQYSINGGSSWKNNGNFNNLQPGEYEIAVRNSNGTCFTIDNQAIDLAYPPEPSIADIEVDQPSDCGNNDGSISIQAANGTGNFQYSINGGNSWKNNGNFNNLQPGEYEIAVRNSNGTCFIIDNQAIDLAYPPEPSIADVEVDQPSDCGNNDGSISIQAANGTGNFQYSINGGSSWKNNGNFNNLQPGEYEIAVRNSNGTCFIIDNQAIDLAYPPKPSIEHIEVDQPSDCSNNDGSISIQAANGTGNFQYSINGGSSWKNNGNFNNLQPGEYEIAVRNSNGTCFIIDNQAIDLAYPPEPSIADVEVEQPSDCGNNDGSISIQAANGTGNFQYSINGGNSWKNNGNFNNLQPGEYEVAVRNSNGTCFVIDNQAIELAYPSEPSITNIDIEQPSNCDVNDASISIAGDDGIGSYTFSIDGGNSWQNSNTFNNLGPGNYQVAIANANGTCEVLSTNTTIIEYPAAPAIVDVITESPAGCGSSNGSIEVIANNGVGSVSYSINNGQSWQTQSKFTNLAPGVYTIKVRNQDQTCEQIYGDIQLNAPSSPAFSNVSTIAPTDCGLSNGQINISATNGTGSFQYSINGGQTWKNTGVFTGLAAGNYTPSIRNSNGTCQVDYQGSLELKEPEPANISSIDIDQPSDCELDDGRIEIDIDQAINGFQFSINGGNTWHDNPLFVNLGPGNYQIGVRKNNGQCEVINTQVVEMSYPAAPEIASIDHEAPSDCGSEDGEILIAAQGGIGNFEYSINNGQNWVANNRFSNLAAGVYTIAVRNIDQSCPVFAIGHITLDEPTAPSIQSVNVEQPTDCGSSNGKITIQANGGNTTNLQFSVDGGNSWQNSSSFNNLSADNYQIGIRNSNGTCEYIDADQIELIDPTPPDIQSVTHENPSNCEDSDGYINIQLNGSTTNKQFSINGGQSWQNSPSFTGLPAGNYQIKVRNHDESCEIIYENNIQLLAPSAPSILAIEVDEVSDCDRFDATININASVGSGPILYSIDNGLSWSTNSSFTNLSPGVYQVVVSNAGGACPVKYAEPIAISPLSPPEILQVYLDSPSDCGAVDGHLEIVAEGFGQALLYSIDGGNNWKNTTLFEDLAPGQYSIQIKYANGTCVVALPQAVTISPQEAPRILDILANSSSSCEAPTGSIQIASFPSTGIIYSIDGGNTWSNSSRFEDLTPGQYQVSIRFADGNCQVDALETINITAPAAPILLDVITEQPSVCGSSDARINIVAEGQGELQYTIDGGSSWQHQSSFENLPPGQYQIGVQNEDGSCVFMAEQLVQISPSSAPEITDVQYTPISDCGLSNGELSIGATGDNPIEYSIDNGVTWQENPVFQQLAAGRYEISLRYMDGSCQVNNIETFEITAPTPPQILEIQSTPPTNCGSSDAKLTIIANGESQNILYSINAGQSWNTDSIFQGLSPGDYQIRIKYADGSCLTEAADVVSIEGQDQLNITDIQINQPSACNSEDAQILVTADSDQQLQYSVDGGQTWQMDPSFSGLGAGMYEISISYTDGSCQINGSDLVRIEAPTAPQIMDVVVDQPTNCGVSDAKITIVPVSPQNIEYTIDGGGSWQAEPVFDNLANGTYETGIRYLDGTCQSNADSVIHIQSPSAPQVLQVTVDQPSSCDNSSAQISIHAISAQSLQYSIDGGLNWSADSVFNQLDTGEYQVSIRNIDGSCQIQAGEPFTIQEASTLLQVSEVLVTQPSACASNGGSINILVDESQSLQFSIDNGENWQDSASFSAVPAGSYQIAVQTPDGVCVVAWPDTVHIEAASDSVSWTAEIQTQDASSCELADGTANISAIHSHLVFSLDNGQSWQAAPQLSNLSPGAYAILARDTIHACQGPVGNFEIAGGAVPEIGNVGIILPSSCSAGDGGIFINPIDTNLLYSIDGGQEWQANHQFTGLLPGTYFVSVSSLDSICHTDYEIPVRLSAQNAATIWQTNTSLPSSCGAFDASLQITILEEDSLFEFSIDNGISWQNNSLFAGLASGTYQAQVRHKESACISIYHPPILIPDPPAFENLKIVEALPSYCGAEDGGILINYENTASPIEAYSIDGGNTWQEQAYFGNLGGGQYEVRVKLAEETCQLVHAHPIDLSFISTSDTLHIETQGASECENSTGTIIIYPPAQGSYEYSIDRGISFQASPIFSQLTPGNYLVRMRDVINECEYEHPIPVEVSQIQEPVITAVNTVPPSSCAGDGVITVSTATSMLDLDYSIDAGLTWQSDSLFSQLQTGVYQVMVRYQNGTCPVSYPDTITFSDSTNSAVTEVYWERHLCSGDSILLGDSIITQAGNYEVVIQQEGSCDSMVNLLVLVYDSTVTNLTATICEGEYFEVGAERYTATGTYQIDFQSAQGCDSTINLQLQVLQPDTTGFSILLCEGESFQYGNESLSEPGTYSFSFESALGCDSVVIVDLDFIPGPAAAQWNVIPPSSCEATDGSIRVTNGTPFTLYSLDNGVNWQNQGEFNGLGNGIYALLVRDIQTNCTFTEEIALFSNSLPQVDSIIVAPGVACGGPNGQISFLMLDTLEIYLFSIDGGQNWQQEASFSALNAGVYDLHVSRADSSCAYFIDQVQILASDSLQAEILTLDHDYCESDSTGVIGTYVVQGSSPYQYLWSTGSDLAEIDQLPPGEYTVTITDSNGCQDSLRVSLDSLDIAVFPDSILQDTFYLCKGETLALTLDAQDIEYQWRGDNGYTAEGRTVEITEQGSYTLTAQSSDGCTLRDSFLVIQGSDQFTANFLLPNAGLINTSIFAVEVSWPIPEQVTWIMDEGQVEQLSTFLNQTELLFSSPGTYSIGMEAQLGDCVQYIEKLITIYSDPDSLPANTNPGAYGAILDFSLFPNPNNGNFELLAEFTDIQTGQMRIYNDTGLLIEARDLSGWASYRENFQIPSAPAGNYIAVLQTQFDYRTLNFVIQR